MSKIHYVTQVQWSIRSNEKKFKKGRKVSNDHKVLNLFLIIRILMKHF